jgi:hypothetical protein
MNCLRILKYHHYGVQIENPTMTWGRLVLRIGPAELYTPIGPQELVTLHDEQSQVVTVENTGTCLLNVEWKKTRD